MHICKNKDKDALFSFSTKTYVTNPYFTVLMFGQIFGTHYIPILFLTTLQNTPFIFSNFSLPCLDGSLWQLPRTDLSQVLFDLICFDSLLRSMGKTQQKPS